MPLSKNVLKNNLIYAFNNIKTAKKPEFKVQLAPLQPPAVAREFAIAYHRYAAMATAGALPLQISRGSIDALAGPLMTIPLWAGWGPGFLAYWTPVAFTGPGFLPANPILPPTIAAGAGLITAEILAGILNPTNMTSSNTEEAVADKLATILHKYTTQLQVLATTLTVPPVVSNMPVS